MAIHVSGDSYSGFVVIDSLVENTSSGGVRVASDLSLEEVTELAREMTLKYSFFGLPRGGAKAGVRLRDDLPAGMRLQAMQDFGKCLRPIIGHGIYNPGMDMNCGAEELQAIYRGAGIEVGRPTDTSYFTALSIANAIAACVCELPPGARSPISVAIAGFGSVGCHLAKRLPADQYRIVSIATAMGAVRNPDGFSVNELTSMKQKHGDELVMHLPGERSERESVLTEQVDILLPAARTRSITATNVAGIRARAIVPISNAPYESGVIDVLRERGVICLPGYVTNAGGVLGSSLFDSGVSQSDIERVFETCYQDVVRILVRTSFEGNTSPCQLAELVTMQHASARGIQRNRWPKLRREWKRRLPRRVTSRLVLRGCFATLDALKVEIASLGHR